MAKGLRVIDDDRIRAGDPLATADAIKAIYDGVLALQNRLAAGAIVWETVEYDATDFSTDVGTWTVSAADVGDYKMARIGADFLALQFMLQATSTGAGAHSALLIRLPRGLMLHPTAMQHGYVAYNDNAAGWDVGLIVADGTGAFATQLQLYKMPVVTVWAAGAVNATQVRGFVFVQLAPVAGN